MLTTDKCISVQHLFAHEDTIQQFTPFWDRFILARQNIRLKTAYAGLYCEALQFTKYFVKVFYVYKKRKYKIHDKLYFKIHFKILCYDSI